MRRILLLAGVMVIALARGLGQSRNLDIDWIKASVAPDGKFTITNGRNGFSKTYVAR